MLIMTLHCWHFNLIILSHTDEANKLETGHCVDGAAVHSLFTLSGQLTSVPLKYGLILYFSAPPLIY